MKVSDLISRTVPQLVTKAHNLDRIGWCDGYLLVRFRGRSTLYIYGPNIAEAEYDKILKNPFPDRIFKLVIRDRYHCYKVGSKMEVTGVSAPAKPHREKDTTHDTPTTNNISFHFGHGTAIDG